MQYARVRGEVPMNARKPQQKRKKPVIEGVKPSRLARSRRRR